MSISNDLSATLTAIGPGIRLKALACAHSPAEHQQTTCGDPVSGHWDADACPLGPQSSYECCNECGQRKNRKAQANATAPVPG